MELPSTEAEGVLSRVGSVYLVVGGDRHIRVHNLSRGMKDIYLKRILSYLPTK